LKFVLIATANNRRVTDFQQALATSGLPAATVIDYTDLIAGKVDLLDHWSPGACLRFDSPERDFDLKKKILAAGIAADDSGSHERLEIGELEALPYDRGRILCPRQWYLGWRSLLWHWAKCWPGAFMNHPQEIAEMFDKRICQERFAHHGLSVPPSLGEISNYDHLRERMSAIDCERVFIKLACGSAATGVVAYRLFPHGATAATTVEIVYEAGSPRFYNSRFIRHYSRRRDIRTIIDWLCTEGAQVETWLPRATRLDGKGFDLRIVVIGGVACHAVVRAGYGPMTNLHLGNERGDIADFIQSVSDVAWATMRRTCERAATLFPRSHYCGVDLLIAPNLIDHAVLEINAFGDLLPNIEWNGLSTHAAEIAAWQTSPGGMPCAI
jgi:hypothetical protein